MTARPPCRGRVWAGLASSLWWVLSATDRIVVEGERDGVDGQAAPYRRRCAGGDGPGHGRLMGRLVPMRPPSRPRPQPPVDGGAVCFLAEARVTAPRQQ